MSKGCLQQHCILNLSLFKTIPQAPCGVSSILLHSLGQCRSSSGFLIAFLPGCGTLRCLAYPSKFTQRQRWMTEAVADDKNGDDAKIIVL